MAVKIKFDAQHNALPPTFVLATRSGEKLGVIPAVDIVFKDRMNSSSELSFTVYKTLDNKEYPQWEQLVDFKLAWCKEWDLWFELSVETDEQNELKKNITATTLAEAELSQTNLYGVEINTESDIDRDDYKVSVLYNPEDKKASILDRMLSKMPHYRVAHVDESIAHIQRSFSFDGRSVYDALKGVSEEIDCLVVPNSGTTEDGQIERSISLYDLESYCFDCKHRGNFSDKCPECGSENITLGYGDDTTIFVNSENLAEEIRFSTNTGSVKNCFKLSAGDDLMTATVISCNPNGSAYIWNLSDDSKADMPQALRDKLSAYDELYNMYNTEHEAEIDTAKLDAYNAVISKYKSQEDLIYGKHNDVLANLSVPIVGYPALIKAYYDTTDVALYLHDGMMPSHTLDDTTAAAQAAKLTSAVLSPVAVQNLNTVSESTATSAVVAMAKTIIDLRYQVSAATASLANNIWRGTLTVVNRSNEDDVATTGTLAVSITGNYEAFVKQKIDKILSKQTDTAGISSMFKLDVNAFKEELNKYCLTSLESFRDAAQACVDMLIKQGIADNKTWADKDPNMYEEVYLPYLRKLEAVEAEIVEREDEIRTVNGDDGLEAEILSERSRIHDALDFENYIGEDLWKVFLSYRREDTYSNDNYISDGLTNAEMIKNAMEFISVAKREVYKSSMLQHSITATVANLLAMKEFSAIVDNFALGNWIRVRIDGRIYRLRLIEYEVNFEDFGNIAVTFSDVQNVTDGFSDIESVLAQASSMVTSYSSVSRQAGQAKKAKDMLDKWVSDGLSLTNMKIISDVDNQDTLFDEHGALFREFIPETGEYSDRQLKIINNGLYVTDDGWETSRAGIGSFMFYNPRSGQTEESYGVIADTLVGSMVLAEEVGIYNSEGTVTIDKDGFVLTTSGDSSETRAVMRLQKKTKSEDGTDTLTQLLYIDDNGDLVINGSAKINSAKGGNAYSIDSMPTRDDIVSMSKAEAEAAINGSTMTEILNARAKQAEDYAENLLNGYSAAIGQWMTFNDNGLTIGAQTSSFSTVIDNQSMRFMEGDATVSYITNRQLHIPEAVIESQLLFGKEGTGAGRFVMSPQADGSVIITWQ